MPVLAQNDPVDPLWVSSLAYVLPPPREAGGRLARLQEASPTPGENPRLGELLERYDRLAGCATRASARLIAPVAAAEAAAPPALAGPGGYPRPLPGAALGRRCRRAGRAFPRHPGLRRLPPGPPLSEESRLDRAAGALRRPRPRAGPPGAGRRALSPEKAPPLRQRFASLVDYYGRRRRHFSLVVLLDQFEEIFTRFVDLGPLSQTRQAGPPDWQLKKYRLFAELRELYLPAPGAAAGRDLLPIRFVISMRSEYIAQLDPIRAFAPDIEGFGLHGSSCSTRKAPARRSRPRPASSASATATPATRRSPAS